MIGSPEPTVAHATAGSCRCTLKPSPCVSTSPPAQEATVVKPWRNAQQISSEALEKEDPLRQPSEASTLRRGVAEDQRGTTAVKPWVSTETSGKIIVQGVMKGFTDGATRLHRKSWLNHNHDGFITHRGRGAQEMDRTPRRIADIHRSSIPRPIPEQDSPEGRWLLRKHAAARQA